MGTLTRRDILGPRAYEAIREEMRRAVIELKRHRRVDIGERVSLVFENRQTLRFQVEEMLRAEGIADEAGIHAELEVYGGLMPGGGALSATLFLEIPRDEEPREALGRLIGIDEHLILHVGGHAVRARFEAGRQEGDRISAVQYTRFPLSAGARAALRAPGTPLAVEIDHPAYRRRVDLDEACRASLAKDLDDE